MPDASTILRFSNFWRFYAHVSGDPLDDDVLHQFGTTDINGRSYAEAKFRLPCSNDFSLEVSINPDLNSSELALWNATANAAAEMGWWDDARCHPCALRWCELQRLHRHWLAESIAPIHPSAGFLLLALFVGHGATERDEFAARKETIAKHYEQLQLFTPSEISALTDRTFIDPFEDDYVWSQDAELGWVFSGNYPCYSIRNREHWGGEEGRFPISDWSKVVDQLRPAEGPT